MELLVPGRWPTKDTARYVLMKIKDSWPGLVSVVGTEEFTFRGLSIPDHFRVYEKTPTDENFAGHYYLDVTIKGDLKVAVAGGPGHDTLSDEATAELAEVSRMAQHVAADPIWRTDF